MSSTPSNKPQLTREEELANIDDFGKKALERILEDAPCCDEHDNEMKILIPAITELCKSMLGKVSPMTMAKGTLLYGRLLGTSILKDVIPEVLAEIGGGNAEAVRLMSLGSEMMGGGRLVEEAVVDDIKVSNGPSKPTLH